MKSTNRNGLYLRRAHQHDPYLLKRSARGLLQSGVYDWRKGIQTAIQIGWYYAFIPNGVPEAILGCWPLHKGVVEVNVVTTDDVIHHSLSFCRACAHVIEQTQREQGLWRAQAAVAVDDEVAVRFAEWAGFTNETENGMRGYGPDGAAYYLMARLWPEALP